MIQFKKVVKKALVHKKRKELTVAFGNTVLIADDLECGDDKKIAVVKDFLKQG